MTAVAIERQKAHVRPRSLLRLLCPPESPFHLVGTFPGPEGSPYDKGLFDIDIQVPEGYPFQPLKMKFITKVYHPNISSQSGAICLDILKDAWSPVSAEEGWTIFDRSTRVGGDEMVTRIRQRLILTMAVCSCVSPRCLQVLTLKSTLLSLRSLLCSPEPSDPQDAEV